MLPRRRNSILVLAGASLIALALAACGGDSSSDDGVGGNTMASSTDAVSTKSVDGIGTVLVDSQRAALYTNDMDRGSKVACRAECATIWIPLAAPSGGQLTAEDSALEAKLGTIQRPDGTGQVTFDGKPLYSFVEDPAGEVTGNGFTDSFAGEQFTWTAATVGTADSGADSETTTSGGGGYGGGY